MFNECLKDHLEVLCESVSGYCALSVHNAPNLFVVSGERASISALTEKLKLERAVVIPLAVSAPFHCRMLTPAARALEDKLAQVEMKPLEIPYIANVDATWYDERTPQALRSSLAEQVVAPVRWSETLELMLSKGIERFWHMGPGRSTLTHVKKHHRKANVATWDDLDALTKLLSEIAEAPTMKGKNVYITAAGMMSALGDSVDSLGLALETGRSAPKLDEKTDKDIFGGTLTATIEGFRAAPFLKNRKNLKLMSRSVQLGMAALKKCYDATQLNGPKLSPDRFGLVVGAGSAIGQNKDLIPVLRDARIDGQFSAEQFGALGMHAINPLWLLKGLSNNILGFASADFDARGFNQNYCNSGIAGLQAIGEGTWAIKEGRAERIIAGGADAPVDIYHLAGFLASKHFQGRRRPMGSLPSTRGAMDLCLVKVRHFSL